MTRSTIRDQSFHDFLTTSLLAVAHGRSALCCDLAGSGELLRSPELVLQWIRREVDSFRSTPPLAAHMWLLSWLEATALRGSSNVLRVLHSLLGGDRSVDLARFELMASWVDDLQKFVVANPMRFPEFRVRDWIDTIAERNLFAASDDPDVRRLLAMKIVEAVSITEVGGRCFAGGVRLHTSIGEDSASADDVSARIVRGVIIDFQLDMEAQILLRRIARQAAGHGTGCAVCGRAVVITEALRYCCHWVELQRLIAARGIAVVFCQRTIDDECRYALVAAGVLPVQRLSIRYVTAVASAMGATAGLLEQAHDRVGVQSSFAVSVIGGRHCIVVKPVTESALAGTKSAVTLVLTVPSRSRQAQVEHSVRGAVANAAALFGQGRVASWPRRDVDDVVPKYMIARQALTSKATDHRLLPPMPQVSVASFRLAAAVLNRQPVECHRVEPSAASASGEPPFDDIVMLDDDEVPRASIISAVETWSEALQALIMFCRVRRPT